MATAGESQVSPSGVNQTDVLEERLIDAEYKIWKKNTPFLYDFVMTHSLEWPSLTVQWLPKVQNSSPEATEHSLLLGTHTTGEQNYLMVASVALPVEEEVVTEGEEGKPPPRYDEDKNEVGGFGLANSNVGKIEIKMKVKHEGEVNRARYMPQNHFVVASRGPSSEVYIFDLSKHSSFPAEDSPFSPQGVCIGHDKEGYGMVWSPHETGLLCTSSEDQTVKIWDINEAIAPGAKPGTQIKPKTSFKGHTATVEDVDWHHKDPNMICSVGDDKQILVWDTRSPQNPIKKKENAHAGDINGVAFNPSNEFLLATGSADQDIGIWDMRNMNTRMHTLKGHTSEVYMVQWAPHCESVLGSCSADRRVGIWDLSRIGAEQTPEDAEDGPPEMLFLHGGHTFKVSDFSWNEKDPWTIASVAEDNILQVWNMAEEIYALDDEEGEAPAGEDTLGDDELE